MRCNSSHKVFHGFIGEDKDEASVSSFPFSDISYQPSYFLQTVPSGHEFAGIDLPLIQKKRTDPLGPVPFSKLCLWQKSVVNLAEKTPVPHRGSYVAYLLVPYLVFLNDVGAVVNQVKDFEGSVLVSEGDVF